MQKTPHILNSVAKRKNIWYYTDRAKLFYIKNGGCIVLKKAYLEITNCCNLSCSFCHKTKRTQRFMSETEFGILTDKLRGRVRYLYFHLMGEPTLHPQLAAFVHIARDKGFLPIITTNGSLLRKSEESLLSAAPHKISISLHAPSANKTFSQPSYLEDCIAFAKKGADRGCYISFRLWNIGSDDESENVEILKKLHEAFAGEWSDVRTANVKKLADRIYLEFAERFDWPDMSAEEREKNADTFCYGLRDQVGILCDGTVVPCCLDAEGILSLGNLFENDLETILNSPRAKAIYNGFSRRRAAEELCRKCGYIKRFSRK